MEWKSVNWIEGSVSLALLSVCQTRDSNMSGQTVDTFFFFFFLRFQMVKVSIYCVQIYHRHTVTFCHTLQLTHNCASHDFCSDCFSPSMSVFRKILWSLVVVEWVAYSACILVCNISCDIWAKQRMSKHCPITSPLMKVTSGFSCYLLEVTK